MSIVTLALIYGDKEIPFVIRIVSVGVMHQLL